MDNSYQQSPLPSQPQQLNTTPPPMPEPPKVFDWLKWVLIITVVAILSSTATYFVIQSQSTKQPPKQIVQTAPSPTPLPSETSAKEGDETANWKTYSSKILGFEIKYPETLQFKEYLFGHDNNFIILTDMELENSRPTEDYILVGAIIAQGAGAIGGRPAIYKGFWLEVRAIPSYSTVDGKDPRWKSSVVNGVNVYRSEDSFKSNGFEGAYLNTSFIKDPYKKQKQYEIIGNFNASKREYFDLYDNIISTFKFL